MAVGAWGKCLFMSRCLTDRPAMAEGKCVWWNMAGAKSQSALLLNLLKEDCVVEKFPKVAQAKRPLFRQVKRELVSGGNNVYVLNFKRFLPVRNSRCKGMFLFFSVRCRGGVTELGTPSSQHTEDVWAERAYRLLPKVVARHSFKIHHVGEVYFLTASDTFKFVWRNIKNTHH